MHVSIKICKFKIDQRQVRVALWDHGKMFCEQQCRAICSSFEFFRMWRLSEMKRLSSKLLKGLGGEADFVLIYNSPILKLFFSVEFLMKICHWCSPRQWDNITFQYYSKLIFKRKVQLLLLSSFQRRKAKDRSI